MGARKRTRAHIHMGALLGAHMCGRPLATWHVPGAYERLPGYGTGNQIAYLYHTSF